MTQTLFLSRGEKQAALDAAQPVGEHSPRAVRTARALIWAVETCPASSRTRAILAARLGLSVRTVVRAVQLAESLGWLTCTPQAGDLSTYQIRWPEIVRAGRNRPQSVSLPEANVTGDRKMSPVTAICHPCQIDVTRDIKMSPVTNGDLTPEKQGSNSPRHGNCVTHAGAMDVCMNDGNTSSIHPSHGPQPARGALGPGGWPCKITAETLQDARQIQSLWVFALSRRWVDLADREAFFALARAIAKAKSSVKSPGGAFTARVKARDWDCGTAADWEWARRAIAAVDSPEPARAVQPTNEGNPPPVAPRLSGEELERRAQQTRQILAGRSREVACSH